MRRMVVCLVGLSMIGLITWAPLSGQGKSDKVPTVIDDANLFSKEAKDKANERIAGIKRSFHRDLVIETVEKIVIPEGVKADVAVDEWAQKRSQQLKVDGIYLGIIVKPAKYRILINAETASGLFGTNDRKELEKILVGHLKAKEMDKALLGVAEFVQETMRPNALKLLGLKIIEVKAGDGPGAKRGDTLLLSYTGKLKEGAVFDKTPEPITLTLREGIVIRGFEQGLVGMKAGGVRKLIVPPELAYGKEGAGDIPPGAELHFEVELLKIR